MATTIYYKATRPDGTDFYSGTVDYAAALESGKPLKRLTSPGGGYHCCSGDVYHASNTPSETLVGGSWPCRLFEVSGKPVAQQEHKFGFRSLRVVREIEPWKALGPNGQVVAEVIEQTRALTTEQMAMISAAWDAARDAARAAAWWAARDAARGAARAAAQGAARDAAQGAARDAARDAAWDAAQGAVRDAAQGAVVKDLITAEHYDILTAPWRARLEVVRDDG